MQKSFSDIIARIRQEEPHYSKEAYFFVREALDFTLKRMQEEEDAGGRRRHVSGQELLEGIRLYALDQYGPMAKTLFDHWNVKDGVDFGRIVFQLVDYGVFGRTEEDDLADFEGGYDFGEAFVKPFLPEKARGAGRPGAAVRNRGA